MLKHPEMLRHIFKASVAISMIPGRMLCSITLSADVFINNSLQFSEILALNPDTLAHVKILDPTR